jgi:hypothetical protein
MSTRKRSAAKAFEEAVETPSSAPVAQSTANGTSDDDGGDDDDEEDAAQGVDSADEGTDEDDDAEEGGDDNGGEDDDGKEEQEADDNGAKAKPKPSDRLKLAMNAVLSQAVKGTKSLSADAVPIMAAAPPMKKPHAAAAEARQKPKQAKKATGAGAEAKSGTKGGMDGGLEEREDPALALKRAKEQRTKRLRQKLLLAKDHVVPEFNEVERRLLKIATRGVVTLFNAVSQQQNAIFKVQASDATGKAKDNKSAFSFWMQLAYLCAPVQRCRNLLCVCALRVYVCVVACRSRSFSIHLDGAV